MIFPILIIVLSTYFFRHQIAPSLYGSTVSRILPDSSLTPGVVNVMITQANIDQNICNKKWSTKSIRPPSSYTSRLKVKQIQEYGYQDTNTKDYELDHLISLELGGNPTDPGNLWPESYTTSPNARDKDKVENYLHAQVCAGAITLGQAQREISTNWIKVFNQMKSKPVYGSLDSSNSDD